MKNRSYRQITVMLMLLINTATSKITVASAQSATSPTLVTFTGFLSTMQTMNKAVSSSYVQASGNPPNMLFFNIVNQGVAFYSGYDAITSAKAIAGSDLPSGIDWDSGVLMTILAADSSGNIIPDLSTLGSTAPTKLYLYCYDYGTDKLLGSVDVTGSLITNMNQSVGYISAANATLWNNNNMGCAATKGSWSQYPGSSGTPATANQYPCVFVIATKSLAPTLPTVPGAAVTLDFTTELTPAGSTPSVANSTITLPQGQTMQNWWFSPTFDNGDYAELPWTVPATVNNALSAGENVIAVSSILANGSGSGWDLYYAMYNASTEQLLASGSYQNINGKAGSPIVSSAKWNGTNITWQGNKMPSATMLGGISAVTAPGAQVIQITVTGNTATQGITLAGKASVPSFSSISTGLTATPNISVLAQAFAEAAAATNSQIPFLGATFSTGPALTAAPSFMFWQFANSTHFCFGRNFWQSGAPYVDWTTSTLGLSGGSWANGYSFVLVAFDSNNDVIIDLSKTTASTFYAYVFDAQKGSYLGYVALPASMFTDNNNAPLTDFTGLNNNGVWLGVPNLPPGISTNYPIAFTVRSGLSYTTALSPIGSSPTIAASTITLPEATDTLTQLWFSPTFANNQGFAELPVQVQLSGLGGLNDALNAGNNLIVASYILPSVTGNGLDLVYAIYNADTQAPIYANSFTTLSNNGAMIPATAQWYSSNVTWQSSSMTKGSMLSGLPPAQAPNAQVFYITRSGNKQTAGLTVASAPTEKEAPTALTVQQISNLAQAIQSLKAA